MPFKSVFSRIILIYFIAFIVSLVNVYANPTQTSGEPKNLIKPRNDGFWQNAGQITDENGNINSKPKYIYQRNNFNFSLSETGFTYSFFNISPKNSISEATGAAVNSGSQVKNTRVDVGFVNPSAKMQIIPADKNADYRIYYNDLLPNGSAHIYNYQIILYKNVWEGIDIVFYGNKGEEIKYDIIVNPGANIADVKFTYNGLQKIALDKQKLKLQTNLGWAEEIMPRSFMKETNLDVNINYALDGQNISFHGKYDKEKTLVIDPKIIWGTYYGDTMTEECRAIGVDKDGNVFHAGITRSTSNIVTGAAYQSTYGGSFFDAYVSKMDKDGYPIWTTYYGGKDDDKAYGLAVDKNGNVFVTGETEGIPASTGAYQTAVGGTVDAFLVKFSPKGSRIWGTHLGGSRSDFGNGLTLDSKSNIYVTGYTYSTNQIATSGAYQTSLTSTGESDAFVMKFDSLGARKWGTYFGGEDFDYGHKLAVFKDQNLYLAGRTQSTSGIATTGAHQTSFGGRADGFLAKLDTSGSKVIWATYYGGSDDDGAFAITTDTTGSVYVVGSTSSTTGIATTGAHKTSTVGFSQDAFLAKFTDSGNLSWGTYYGGDDLDFGDGVATDNIGNVYLTGTTMSSTGISTDYSKYKTGTYTNIFIAQFTWAGARSWATYYGGETGDFNDGGVVTDNKGNLYIGGSTFSYWHIATENAYRTSLSRKGSTVWASDIFLAKFSTTPYEIELKEILLTTTEACNFNTSMMKVVVKNNGVVADSNIMTNYGVLFGKLNPGQQDTLTLRDTFILNQTGDVDVIIFLLTKDDDARNDTVKAKVKNFSTGIIRSIELLPYSTADLYVICQGTTVTFTDISYVPWGTVVTDRVWDFGDGDTANSRSSVKHIYTKPGYYTSILYIYTNSGCIDTISRRIFVDALPESKFSFATACVGQEAVFTDNTKKITGGYWNFGEGNGYDTYTDSSQKVVKHIYTKPGKYTVGLMTFNENYCLDTVEHEIVIYPAPHADFNFNTACEGQEISFNNLSTIDPGYNIQSVLWHFGDGDSSVLSSPKHVFKKAGLYSVKLTATSQNGCTSQTIKQVQIHAVPVVNYTVPKTGCVGELIAFKDNSTVTGTATYKWKFGNGDSSQLKNVNITFKKPGKYIYQLKVTGSGNCFDEIKDSITIYSTPSAKFTIARISGRKYKFTPADQTQTNYMWTFGNGQTSTAISPEHEYTLDGTYPVKLVIENAQGCDSSFSQALNINTTSVSEVNNPEKWLVYPNPVIGGKIIIEPASQKPLTLHLYDVAGKLVFSKYLDGTLKHEVQLPSGLKGIYMLRMVQDNSVYNGQILVD